MEKISGLVLDIYDDPSGMILKSVFPQSKDVPDFIKHSHALTNDERNRLEDDEFALVITQDGLEMKKFATIDSGNTALSIIYFLKTAHKLPVEAQIIAANNLCCACNTFAIEPPEELCKIASGMTVVIPEDGKAKNAFITAALMAPGAFRQAKKNLQVAQGAGEQIVTPGQIKAQEMKMGLL